MSEPAATALSAWTRAESPAARTLRVHPIDCEPTDAIATALCDAAKAAGNAPIDILIDADISAFDQSEDQRQLRNRADALTRALCALGVRVRWLIPLNNKSAYRLEGWFSCAEDAGAAPIVSAFAFSAMTADDALFAADFLRYRILDQGAARLSLRQRRALSAILRQLDGGPGAEQTGLAADLLHFSETVSGPGGAGALSTLAADALEVGSIGLRAHGESLFARASSDRGAAAPAPFKKALLIGAYGGEHIGDAAILGGVLFRLHRRHGLSEAVLYTQRLAHTRHLLEMIDTPVRLIAEDYQLAAIDAHIASADAVVFAGGPLIDLPKQLVRHLYAASRARKLGKAFIMEGIGPGPFTRWPSEVTARKLVDLADYISLRNRDCAESDIVKGAAFDIGRDPAFDYLETRGQTLTKLRDFERAQIEALLAGAEGCPVIGINIRPIHHHYTVVAEGEDKVATTAMTQDRFESRLAAALSEYSERAGQKPRFIFFPMNAIQFGMSDLKSAHRIARRLGSDVDFRVWEADASLDAVLALIRRLDLVVAMRFHATIFALSQNIEVIGVDYRIGARDKVAAVLDDCGKGDQVKRIDEMTREWLVSQFDKFL